MANLGNLIVTGAARFLNNLYGNLVGTINGFTVGKSVPSDAVFTDTKYTAATAAPGKVASASSTGTSANYARQDHTHGIDLATGDSNGQVKIAGSNVAVKGLGAAAYMETGTSASTVALGNHTHNYAGSSSAGGVANSAAKLTTSGTDTAVGEQLQPVYFSGGVPVASTGNTIPFIVGTGSTAGTWLGELTGLTEYTDGLLILYKPSVAGNSTTTLNLNDLGAKTCYLYGSNKLTSQYPVNQPLLLVYSSSQNSGCWMCVDGYYNGNTIPSAYCTSGPLSPAKTALCNGFVATKNQYIHVLMLASNNVQSRITLNINATGSKPIYINGSVSSSSNYTLPAGAYIVFYDGTNYYFRTDGKLPADISGAAEKLSTNAGSSSVPVYFTNGKPSAVTTTSAAASGGTDLTLVTTGEKYNWDNKVVELTQTQYDALTEAQKKNGSIYLISDGTTATLAEDVGYDNTDSGLSATNVQDALDEIVNAIPEQKVGTANDLSSFLNGWTSNGACFYQKIGNMCIIFCSIRLGTLGSEVSILQMPQGLYPVNGDAVAPCINLGGQSFNGYVRINTSGTVILHNVTSATSAAFTLMYRCA